MNESEWFFKRRGHGNFSTALPVSWFWAIIFLLFVFLTTKETKGVEVESSLQGIKDRGSLRIGLEGAEFQSLPAQDCPGKWCPAPG